MSYIRCLSNPEGLYIWGGCDGTHIWEGKKQSVVVNSKHFDGLLEKAVKTGWYPGDEPLRVGSLKVEEVFVNKGKREDWGAPMKDRAYRIRMNKKFPGSKIQIDGYKHKPCWYQPGDFKVLLTVKTKKGVKKFYMWVVTWMYLLTQNNFTCNLPAGHRGKSRRW